MTDAEPQVEGFVVFRQQLETTYYGSYNGGGWHGVNFHAHWRGHDGGFFFGGGRVSQTSSINQHDFKNQIGGDCIGSSCDQFNAQSNAAFVSQNAFQRFGLR